MMNKKIAEMLNEQINKELYSSYLYLDMSNYYTDQNLDGFANWFKIQAKEELDHALLFMTYLQNCDCTVSLGEIKAPDLKYTSIKDPLVSAYAHEQMITQSIYDIYSEALALKDFNATQFLDWFVKEQGEEEKNSNDLCKKYDLFGHDAKGLYMMNV
ncbi:MAG: ferritin, partial [Oscillospiraceae bacterium]